MSKGDLIHEPKRPNIRAKETYYTSKRDLLYERILFLQRGDRSHGSAASVRTAAFGRRSNTSGKTNRVRRTEQKSKETYYMRNYDSVQKEHQKREEERNTKRKREKKKKEPNSHVAN
jgi:hypothetical protein